MDQIGDDHFRTDVGLVPQEPFLLAASARENIDMGRGLPDDADRCGRPRRARRRLHRRAGAGIRHAARRGRRATILRAETADRDRARAGGSPRILFLDEATSRIDSETEQRVQAALAELHGSTTVIAIAHRLSTIRAADRIVVLNHGRIAEQGTHDALMAIEGGIYQRLYLLQQIGE